MSTFETYDLKHNSILSVFAEQDTILMNPEYQRQGEIWSEEKRQLLIDSIINKYDIPKLYFHKLPKKTAKLTGKDFAVIDGRQRLEAIFGFLDGEFALADDFSFLQDESINARGLTYNDLAKKHPRLKQRLDSFSLPIVCVDTDDLELIEDMFYRLNEAVPLNAAEKRNAIGGDMALATIEVSKQPFFTRKVRFSNKRYQHRDVSTRLLAIEHNLLQNKWADTRKASLDQFVREFRAQKTKHVAVLKNRVVTIVKAMFPLFSNRDILLASQSSIPVYYLAVRDALEKGTQSNLNRGVFYDFNDAREKNREVAATDLAKASYDLLEFDRLSQQGTNDASNLKRRFEILQAFCSKPQP